MAFRLLTSNKALIFQIVSTHVLRIDDAESCKTELFNYKHLYSLIMLDLSKIQTADLIALKILAEIGRSLVGTKIRLMVIAADPIIQLIREKGYSDVLQCYVGVVPVPLPDDESVEQSEIDAESFLNVTLPAIQENLRVYAKKQATFGERVSCAHKDRPNGDIAGVGGFFCNNRRGNLMLCFNKDSYLKIVSAIMKKEFKEIEPPISDWAAELVNSILGKVKSDLRAIGYSFSSGIPTVFFGKDLEVFYSTKIPSKLDIVKCSGDFGEFFVNLVLTGIE